ncbi:MAG: alpha/beta hydrolase [Verrucomicrobia bacterium]|nr:alpha/beta hydrolase [Verrucomicrobiota bacterium]
MKNIALLIMIAVSFCSYRRIVRDKIGCIPLVWIAKWPLSFLVVNNRHSPEPAVRNISPTPLLLIHGTCDRVIPYHHAKCLFREAREPKELWTIEGGDHTEAFTTYGATYRRQLVQFFTSAVQSRRRVNE